MSGWNARLGIVARICGNTRCCPGRKAYRIAGPWWPAISPNCRCRRTSGTVDDRIRLAYSRVSMTAKFPSRKYPDAGTFVADYVRLVATGLTSVRSSEIDRAAATLKQAIRDDRLIFAC